MLFWHKGENVLFSNYHYVRQEPGRNFNQAVGPLSALAVKKKYKTKMS